MHYFTAGPGDNPPNYTEVDAQPLNRVITQLFRKKMVAHLGVDSRQQGYDAIIDLTRKLNTRYARAEDTQHATQNILRSLFPSWLLPAFRAMFSRPFPEFSCQLNAWVTALTCQWLMGPSKVNDVELPDGTTAKSQGVLVERCRYLEQSGCASICINSCKAPTQRFFLEDMALPLTMTPNYEDFSCQFAFGVQPQPEVQDEAFQSACFTSCPSKQPRRQCTGIQVEA